MFKNLLLLMAGLAATSLAQDAESSCIMNGQQKCPVNQLRLKGPSKSAFIYPGGETRCAYDDFKDNTTSLVTKKDYFFQVFPERNRDKVVFFFQGGGGCVDDMSCSFAASCGLASAGGVFNPNARPADNSGIFDKTNDANPFKDWNLIHLSYCTGDLHVGKSVRDLPVPPPLKSKIPPACAVQKPIHQVGYVNTMAVLDWAIKNYPNPRHIVISGFSAGSLGAQSFAKLIADKYKATKRGIAVTIAADSYVGIAPQPTDAGKLVKYYGGCDNDLGMTQEVKDKCNKGEMTLTDFIGGFIQALPDSSWLFVNTKADKTQRKYFLMLRDGLAGFPFTNLPSEEFFFKAVNEVLDAYKKLSQSVQTFFGQGDAHGLLPPPTFYSAQDDEGEKVVDFIARWLSNDFRRRRKAEQWPQQQQQQQQWVRPNGKK